MPPSVYPLLYPRPQKRHGRAQTPLAADEKWAGDWQAHVARWGHRPQQLGKTTLQQAQ
ncbi:MAG TPA: hypothetical protein PLD25_17270 [Chloroflexota bacterium]|nr:hypothetical protein [Chloroflexota bacterium]